MMTDDTTAIFAVLGTATSPNVFGFATLVVRLCMLIAMAAVAAGLFLRIVRKPASARALAMSGWVGLGFGLFGAAYSALNSYMGFRYFPIDRGHTITRVELAPHIAVVAYCIALAGLAWAIGRYGAGQRK